MADEQPTDLKADLLVAIDAALEPVRRLAAMPQPMNTAHLGVLVSSFRQAIALLVYGPPPKLESRVEDPQAEASASLVAGHSEPQFTSNEPVADAADPGAEADDVFA